MTAYHLQVHVYLLCFFVVAGFSTLSVFHDTTTCMSAGSASGFGFAWFGLVLIFVLLISFKYLGMARKRHWDQ